MESAILNEQQRLYLQIIFDHFNEHGLWPTYSYVERTLFQSHPDLDVDELVKSFPPGLTKPFDAYLFDVPGYASEDTFLTVPAAASRTLDFFFLLHGRRRELAVRTLKGNTPLS